MNINGILFSAYKKIPKEMKKKLARIPNAIPLNILYGKEYSSWLQFLNESQYWNEEQRMTYEVKKLRETLTCAYKNTDYYKTLFDECGFDAATFRYKDQLDAIPFLTKQIIQKNLDSLVNHNFNSNQRKYVTTGGSTGIPMGFYIPENDKVKESAFINYMWGPTGYKHTARIAVLRGNYLGERGAAYRNGNRLFLSSYYMREEDMYAQYKALLKFKPEYFHVYPSAVYILCDFIERNCLEPIYSLKAVLTASENLYPYQRQKINQALKCRIYDFYGHSEHACMAGACECSDKYHVYWQYGYTELLNSQGKQPDKENEPAEIVATTFDNPVMPLIRYKTMDIASYSKERCKCGRNYQIINRIEGRLQELLVTASGRYISMTAINMHDSIFDHVRQFQFYQDCIECCVLNIVKAENYSVEDEKNIIKKISEKIGSELKLKIKYVSEIPRTKSGKYRFLVQKLPIHFGSYVYEEDNR